jgi:hypothetical protein
VRNRDRLAIAGITVWGLLLAFWLARAYFLHPADRIHDNHESYTYSGRLVEFRDLLAAGYVWPQWCTHFRGGLGAPYFSYYQPGFFYAASLVPWSVAASRALGLAVCAFALLGYLSMYGLVSQRFGRLSGWLGASALLLSVYAATEIYVRGGLSEFAAMMTLPAALWALAGWLQHKHVRYLAWLAASAAALITLHPAVALVGFMVLALGLAGFTCLTRQIRPAMAAAVALGLGVGLAAFYWFPVFFEWDLVSAEAAFAGFYSYRHHFVDPLRLLGPYQRQGIIPFSLGLITAALLIFNTLVLLLRGRKMTAWQRRQLAFCLLGIVVFVLLMSRASAPLWASIPILGRLQFPWRILTVVTVLAAAVCGSMAPWKAETARAMVVGSAVLLMWGLSWRYTEYHIDPIARNFRSVEQLARTHFAPDLSDEWLPRGAEADIPEQDRLRPSVTGDCRVGQFERAQGRLRCHVRARGPSSVTLPHYYFPVGWKARLAGRPVELTADSRGLMRVELREGTDAWLEIRFARTPARSWGILLSAVSLLAAVVVLILPATRQSAKQLRLCPTALSCVHRASAGFSEL